MFIFEIKVTEKRARCKVGKREGERDEVTLGAVDRDAARVRFVLCFVYR
jgi:hypothetical protein